MLRRSPTPPARDLPSSMRTGPWPHPSLTGMGSFKRSGSPDGQWIAGARYSGDNYDIWKIHPDGGGLTQVTNLPGDELSPTWSPDGGQLAFEDRPTADIPSHIARVSSSGGTVTNLTPGHGRDYEPSWSPTAIASSSSAPGSTEVS